MSSSAINNRSEIGCVEVKNDYFTFEWIIKEFSFLPPETGDFMYSPDFHTANNELKCYLSIYPQGEGGRREDAGYVTINLYVDHHKADETTRIKINTEVSIHPSGMTQKNQFTWHGQHGNSEYPKLIQRSELLKLCASDNTVRVRVKIHIPLETMPNIESMEQAIDSQGGQLSQAFRLFLKESKLSDVVVIVETQKFPAHKLILAARSSVFSAMFENKGMQENVKNEVKIEEMEPGVVEAMLEFFYTDEVTNLEELAYGLLAAAEKYDVQRLKSMCENVFYKTLNIENAAEILVHADLHHSSKLKEHVMKYMDHNLSDVVEMESYKEMKKNNPALVMELVDFIAARRKTNK